MVFSFECECMNSFFNRHYKQSLFCPLKWKFIWLLHIKSVYDVLVSRPFGVMECIFVLFSFFIWKLISVKVFNINRRNAMKVTNLSKIKFPRTKAINKSRSESPFAHCASIVIAIVIVGQKWKSILSVIYLHAFGWHFTLSHSLALTLHV